MEKSLSELNIRESGRVRKIHGEGMLRRRLLDMGIIPGVTVEVTKIAPLGDPVDIKVKGYQLSLRKEEAAQISIETD